MFKVGDEVFIKGEILETDKTNPHYSLNVDIPKIGEFWTSCEFVYRTDKNYEQGLADAWELARKVYALELDEREKILGYQGLKPILEDLTPEYVADAIEAYEKEKEIKVGDVVESRDTKRKFLVVTEEDDDSVYEFGVIDLKTLTLDRICNYPKGFTKTGKHIDIESLLRQIGE